MIDELAKALERVVDRLNSMPLDRVARCSQGCLELAQYLINETRRICGNPPQGADLPRLAPHGLGAMVAVTGRDYLDAVSSAPGTSEAVLASQREALERLEAFRHSLP